MSDTPRTDEILQLLRTELTTRDVAVWNTFVGKGAEAIARMERELAEKNNSLSDDRRLDKQVVYSIALQRAIEAHCRGQQVPPNVAKECPHHAKKLDTRLSYAVQLADDAKIVLRGFDEGVFVREIAHDAESGWALKLIPYMQALGRLAANVNPETAPPIAECVHETCTHDYVEWTNGLGQTGRRCSHCGSEFQSCTKPSMTTFEIRSWLAPATGGCEQQVERLLAHLAELEWRPGEVAPCAHAWFTDQHALHRAISEKMPLPMPVCSKCGISKAEHIFGAPQPVEPLFGVSRHQVNSDARDAARYRWLRDQLERRDIPIASCVWKRDSDPDGEWVNLVNAEDLDRHIDAAGFGITTLRHVAGKKPPEDVWRTQAVLAMNQAVLEWEDGKVLGPTISLLRSLRDEGSK